MNQGGYGDGMGGGGEYYNSYEYNEYGENQHQQYNTYNDGSYNEQQGYYDESQQYQEGYYDEGGNSSEYYPGEEQQQMMNNQYGEYTATTDGTYNDGAGGADPNSLFYPSQAPFVVHANGQADNYGNFDTQSHPISAIAIDDGDASNHVPSLLYVASHTAKQGAEGNHRRSMSSQNKAFDKDPSLNRGSRLTVFYEDVDNVVNNENGVGFYGNRSIYSSFVGHPEAERRILDGLHSVLFGGNTWQFPGTKYNSIRKARPSHAYGPPFGPPANAHDPNLGSHHFYHGGPHQQNNHRPEEKHCMGITSIFPVSTPYLGSGGRVCSVSPHGVRIHTRGGMIMSDKSDGLLSGMTCGELLESGSQFATVAGMSFPGNLGGDTFSGSSRRPQHVHCVDLNRDLKVVSSHTLVRSSSGGRGGGGEEGFLCVSDIATNRERNNIVVGCSDGTIRVLDGGRRNAEIAKAKAQIGGVAQVAVSENLIVATGYASHGVCSPSSPLPYPFPAPHVLIYDVRYLGRGGIPHMFSANRGGPRFVNFLPDGKLLVGSGQTFGSFEVIAPFEESGTSSSSSAFFQPELNAGEAMTTVDVHGGDLYIGSSYGRVLQYGLSNYEKTTHAPSSPQRPRGISSGSLGGGSMNINVGGDSFGASTGGMAGRPTMKEPLDMPPFGIQTPALSIDPTIFLAGVVSSEQSLNGWNVFDGFVMAANPILSSDKALFHPRYSRSSIHATTLGPISSKPLVAPSKRWLSKKLQTKLDESAQADRGSVSSSSADYVKVFPASSLELNDLLVDSTAVDSTSQSSNYQGKKGSRKDAKKSFPNPNKLIYSSASFAACYDATADPRKKMQYRRPSQLGEEDLIDNEENGIPRRYRLFVRPPFYKVSNFDYTAYNESGVFLGWDYSNTYANSFACSVLSLLYFIGEVRTTALKLQLLNNQSSIQKGKPATRESGVSVTAELGLLFNLIESLSSNGMIQPDTETSQQATKGQVKAYVPSNFLSAFTQLPEATNLALIDGVAGSAELARRPEAFYRFLMQYMERELGRFVEDQSNNQGHLIDLMQGMDWITVIEFAQGKPKLSTSRTLTVDLSYDQKWSRSDTTIRFGEILRYSLCKEAPLRAYNDETRNYEAVVQRKIATSLPSLLSLSCCCAGTKADTLGLQFWQQESSQNWLPEFISIQIETDKSITVTELAVNENGDEEWVRFEQSLPLSDSFFESIENELPRDLPIKKEYRLDAVVSFIRTHADESAETSQLDEGHHVVHVRAPVDLEVKALTKQLHQIEKCLSEQEGEFDPTLTLVSGLSLETRQKQVQEQLDMLKEKKDSDDEWLLLNGFVVSKVNADDVRSFNAKFKEPSIVLFREMVNETGSEQSRKVAVNIEPSQDLSKCLRTTEADKVPVSAMATSSISNNGVGPKLTISDLTNLPARRDLVAIDAEFVCVQQEESLISYSGSKEIISEPRNALGRLSIIDCRNDDIIIDDYVLPQEPVVDYLTRFSGINPNDLDANNSPHHLVTPQEAYLKVRLLMERGCIFVGHGLSQDFRVINICIPPNQIIDTAEIYHQPNQRYISLRYLTNYVLGRDMQQEVHDSVEDAKAAHELYIKALTLKKEGKFDDYLMQLYAHGHKTQFKLGVAHDK